MATRCRSSRQRRVHVEADGSDDTMEQDFPEVPEQRHRSYRAWTNSETQVLKNAVAVHGTSNWVAVGKMIPGRTSKQCRDRWHNFAADGIISQKWTADDDLCIAKYHAEHGPKWSKISRLLPGRTQLSIKNRWHSVNRAKGSSSKTLLHAYVRELQSGSSPQSALALSMKEFPGRGITDSMQVSGNSASTNDEEFMAGDMDNTTDASTSSDPVNLRQAQSAAPSLPIELPTHWLANLPADPQPPPLPSFDIDLLSMAAISDDDHSPQGSASLSCPGTPIPPGSDPLTANSSPTTNTNSPTNSQNPIHHQTHPYSRPHLASSSTIQPTLPHQHPQSLHPFHCISTSHPTSGSPNLSSNTHHLPNIFSASNIIHKSTLLYPSHPSNTHTLLDTFSNPTLIHKPTLLHAPNPQPLPPSFPIHTTFIHKPNTMHISKSDPTFTATPSTSQQPPFPTRTTQSRSLSMCDYSSTHMFPDPIGLHPDLLHTTARAAHTLQLHSGNGPPSTSQALKQRAAFFANLAGLHMRAAVDLGAKEAGSDSIVGLGLGAASSLVKAETGIDASDSDVGMDLGAAEALAKLEAGMNAFGDSAGTGPGSAACYDKLDAGMDVPGSSIGFAVGAAASLAKLGTGIGAFNSAVDLGLGMAGSWGQLGMGLAPTVPGDLSTALPSIGGLPAQPLGLLDSQLLGSYPPAGLAADRSFFPAGSWPAFDPRAASAHLAAAHTARMRAARAAAAFRFPAASPGLQGLEPSRQQQVVMGQLGTSLAYGAGTGGVLTAASGERQASDRHVYNGAIGWHPAAGNLTDVPSIRMRKPSTHAGQDASNIDANLSSQLPPLTASTLLSTEAAENAEEF